VTIREKDFVTITKLVRSAQAWLLQFEKNDRKIFYITSASEKIWVIFLQLSRIWTGTVSSKRTHPLGHQKISTGCFV
jgi:hypothetical protein